MTITINMPIFPMRKEIEARKARKAVSFLFSMPGLGRSERNRSRDAEGYLEMEMLPLEELEGVRRPKPKAKTPSGGKTS